MRLIRPLHLIFTCLTYTLGAGIADYLGDNIQPTAYILGLLWVCLVQVSMYLLAEVFRPANEPINGLFGAERVYLRDRLLVVSIGLLAIAAACAYLLFLSGRVAQDALIFFALSVLIVVAYAVPPLNLARRGLGEFLLAAHLGYVAPSISFILQGASVHRLVPILSLPITALALVYFLVLDFPSFADDVKYERFSLLTRLGWQRAIPLHHSLIILAFTLLAAAPLLGLSLALIWPTFLTVPFAIIQIILLRNIALGARPLWRPLMSLAATLFALTTYLLTFSLFFR